MTIFRQNFKFLIEHIFSNNQQQLILKVFSLFMALVVFIAIPVTIQVSNLFLKGFLYMFFLFLLIILIYLLLNFFLFGYSHNPTDNSSKRINIFLYAAPPFIIWSLYLLIYYPGIMTVDSILQWEQIINFSFNDWHPVYHTLFNWLLTRIWFSPAIVAIFQILFLSLLFGYGMYLLHQNGVPKKVIMIIMAFFSLNPVNGLYAITLWKDIPYSSLLFALTFVFYKLVFDKSWLNKVRNQLLLSFIIFSTTLLRHNGIITSVLSLIVLFLIFNEYRKVILKIGFIVTLSVLLLKGPIYNFLDVKSSDPKQSAVLPIHQVAAMFYYDGEITEQERQFLGRIFPLEYWKLCYHPYQVGGFIFNDKFNDQEFQKNKKVFLKIWLKLIVRNPKIAIKSYLTRTSIIWRISQPQDGYIYTTQRHIASNDFGIVMDSKLPKLKKKIDFVIDETENWRKNPIVTALVWRPALYVYLCIFFGFIFVFRNGIKSVIVLAPVLFNVMSLLVITTSASTRYLYSAILVAPFLLGLALIKISNESNANFNSNVFTNNYLKSSS